MCRPQCWCWCSSPPNDSDSGASAMGSSSAHRLIGPRRHLWCDGVCLDREQNRSRVHRETRIRHRDSHSSRAGHDDDSSGGIRDDGPLRCSRSDVGNTDDEYPTSRCSDRVSGQSLERIPARIAGRARDRCGNRSRDCRKVRCGCRLLVRLRWVSAHRRPQLDWFATSRSLHPRSRRRGSSGSVRTDGRSVGRRFRKRQRPEPSPDDADCSAIRRRYLSDRALTFGQPTKGPST